MNAEVVVTLVCPCAGLILSSAGPHSQMSGVTQSRERLLPKRLHSYKSLYRSQTRARLLVSVHRAANLFSQQGPRGGGGDVPAINSWKANGNGIE